MDQIRVLELFAGVGGFRLGFDKANRQLGTTVFDVIFSNQWEPSTKVQHASDVYVRRYGSDGHSNLDITTLPATDIPDGELLVGGFPCQDYSVATALQRSGGLEGSKGVLWWEIHRILRDKEHRPQYLLLENVDRLLKSPVSQRGRDFAVMLASLADLGYAVEWRVINAADYGMAQRRRRVFIFGYLDGTNAFNRLSETASRDAWLLRDGVVSNAFPVCEDDVIDGPDIMLKGSLADISNGFKTKSNRSPFLNSGVAVGRHVFTKNVSAEYTGKRYTLGKVLLPEHLIPETYFITENLDAWKRLKGPKKIEMVNKVTGTPYVYAEGGVSFPDHLDRPSRTIVTGEGGASPSRFKHVVTTESGRLRRLTPVELERLNMFPDDYTEGLSDSQRAFLMGNALVTGVVERLGVQLAKHHTQAAGADEPSECATAAD